MSMFSSLLAICTNLAIVDKKILCYIKTKLTFITRQNIFSLFMLKYVDHIR